jgi:hypothetical protein
MPEIEQETLAAQAYEEIAAEKEGREPVDLLSTPKKDEKKKTQSDDPTEEPAKDGETGDAKDGNKEDKAEEEADETEEKPADEAEEKPADGETEEKPADTEQNEDKKIADHAEKEGMTYAEAKEDLDKNAEIIKLYKNDPVEMAKALRNKDREYHKLKAEAEKAAAKKEPVFQRMSDRDYINFARTTIPEKHPELIQKYREDFPAKSDRMSDEEVIEEVAQFSLAHYKSQADKKEAEAKTEANKKRDSLIASIPSADRRFLPDVKAMLLETSDATILNGGGEALMKDTLYWAKGKNFDAEIKAAEERGFKRAKEGAVIIGTKPISEGSKPQGGKPAVGADLTKDQKNRAVEMYGNSYEPDVCYKLFKETFEEELKNNHKFVN